MSARLRKLSPWLAPVALVAAFLVGRATVGERGAETGGTVQEAEVWTCSMHPQFQLPEAGRCPICFMDLIPLEQDTGADLGPTDLALSEAAVALADIRTEPAERRAVSAEIPLVGRVEYDETRLGLITARVAGRLETLHADATGTVVGAGDPLVDIYSPELYAARVELRSAVEAVTEAEENGSVASPAAVRRVRATLAAVRERLRLWGLDDAALADLESGRGDAERWTLRSPLSGVVVRRDAIEGQYVREGAPLYAVADLSIVWIVLEAYESDLAWLRPGQSVEFTARGLSGRDFDGEILFVDPVLDPGSRTADVRVAVDNADGLLKPGMLVNARALASLDPTGQPEGETDVAPELPLVIPVTAPLLTGRRAVVYVRDPDAVEPVFSGREVVLGPRAGEYYVVLNGLVEGEKVVTRGAFKLDSALQIQARPSLMNPPPRPEPYDGPSAEAMAPLLAAYLPLQAALAGDDDEVAVRAAAILAAAAERHDAPLAEAAHRLHHAEGIAGRRVAFEPVSDRLWYLVTGSGHAPADTLRRIHCPMAFDFAGADWIQVDPVVSNPYFGNSMLRCGTQEEIVAAAFSGEVH